MKTGKLRIITALILCFSFLSPLQVHAAPLTGYTRGYNIQLRDIPVNGQVVRRLDSGTVLRIEEETEGQDGISWYRVTIPSLSCNGYIRSDFVSMGKPSEGEEDRNGNTGPEDPSVPDNPSGDPGEVEGFPESYSELLSVIKGKYPLWEFKAYNPAPNMTFDECVDAETGISVIQGKGFAIRSAEVSLKWAPAGREKVAYYLDPRNFIITEKNELNPSFFQFLSGSSTVGASESGVESILSTTSMTGEIPGEGVTYSSAVYDNSVAKGINPYLVAARMRQEHGNKYGDDLINGNYSGYEGYYNYFNIKANGDDPVLNGLKHAKEEGWNSRLKSIKAGIVYLADNYINNEDHTQDTLYKQRFFFKDGSYYHQYMTAIYAAKIEAQHVYQGYSGNLSALSEGVFLIPVYNGMPDTPASL